MHLLLASAFDFRGQAPVVARHRALLKGWVEAGLGSATLVLLTTPPGKEPEVANGIRVVGVGQPSLGGWRVAGLRGLRAVVRQLREEHDLPDAALLIDRDPLLLPGAIKLMHDHGVPAIHEITEFPDVVARSGIRGGVEVKAFERFVLDHLDGVLCISPQISTWVRSRSRVPLEQVTGLVDLELFSAPSPPSRDGILLGYCGSLDEQKDGIRSLLRSVALSGQSMQVRVIAGPHSKHQRADLDSEIALAGLEGRVEVIGPVPSTEVAMLLADCDVLALPRPVSRQAEGGFPTKLGEYLATGRPVVVSAVGSIPRSLTAGVDAVIVPPGDNTAWAAALSELARDPGRRAELGRVGRTRAETDWSPRQAAKSVARLVERVSVDG